MKPVDVKDMITRGLLATFGDTSASKELIITACDRIYQLGREQGLNEAYESVRKAWKPMEDTHEIARGRRRAV